MSTAITALLMLAPTFGASAATPVTFGALPDGSLALSNGVVRTVWRPVPPSPSPAPPSAARGWALSWEAAAASTTAGGQQWSSVGESATLVELLLRTNEEPWSYGMPDSGHA